MKILIRLHCLVAAVLFSGALFLLLLNAGCEVVTTGAVVGTGLKGAITYHEGDLSATLFKDYASIVNATTHALTQLQPTKPEQHNDGTIDVLTTQTASGDAVHVILTKVSNDLTKVTIRVGDGNEYTSRDILAEIRKY